MKSRNKEHKPHENIIGKIIYGFLLFMPLLAIGVTCAYAIFNKNAYQSYSGENNTSETYIEDASQLRLNNGEYTYVRLQNNNINSNTNYDVYFICNDFEVIESSSTINEIAVKFNVQSFSTNIILTLYNSSSQQIVSLNSSTATLNFKCVITGISNITNTNSLLAVNKLFYTITDNNYRFIDNVFYYSIDKVQQSPLFNWAEDSAIYTGMTATCNALNITTTFIPLLMTYWLIISVIYILYDIILVILHIFHKKIHQLEDSF